MLLVAVGAAAVFLAGCGSEARVQAASRGNNGTEAEGAPVTVAVARLGDVPLEIHAIGNAEAYTTISVKAQVGGALSKVDFREGSLVKKGDLLFTIDPRPYQTVLDQALANVAQAQAAEAEAAATLARDAANLRYQRDEANRYGALFKGAVVSKDQTEQLKATADATSDAVAADRAAIESAKAQLEAAQAAVDEARVELGYTSVRSPVNGRTGNLNITVGNVVTANSDVVTTITQVSPIYVTFQIPEGELGEVQTHRAEGNLMVEARPQGNGATETGVLTFVDNAVDTTTGTIKLKGTFPNADGRLWPGQFVEVTLRLAMRDGAVVVPDQAIQTGQAGTFVYVLRPDQTVEQRAVKAGLQIDDDVVIDHGLSAGETVITQGQVRLAPGTRVAVRNASL
ncbi:MAG TPA: efflux RND transporter periplasmic adaptor subunit [Bryobacteraceae bacterium]|nr:efflux RND transporter periplasmic adaptor subunit [Bryobacteraceae bacterium]